MSKPRIRISGAMPVEMKTRMRDAVEYFANELMSPQLIKNLHIHVRYKRELDAGTQGECEVVSNSLKPRRFKITIQPKNDTRIGRGDVFRTLAHEMVHVKQYAYKELKHKIGSVEKATWKGRYVNEDKVKYEKLPWEKEAFRKEEYLFIGYACGGDTFDYFFG